MRERFRFARGWFLAAVIVIAAGLAEAVTRGTPDREGGAPSAMPATRPLSALERQGVFVDRERREIVLHGEIVFRSDDILEYFCCSVGTAEHESIIAVKANPLAVRLALMLPPFRLKPGRVIRWEEDAVKPPEGPPVLVFAEYEDTPSGKTVRVRAEDWVLMEKRDPATGRRSRVPMKKTGFVFAGGSFYRDVRDGRLFFRANGDGAIVTIYNRISSVIDNPQREGATDEVWFPNVKAIPPLGTKVRVILRPAGVATSQPAGDSSRSASPPADRAGKP